MSYATIMVPLDGSGFAEQAVPTAAGLARAAGARLHLVHVHASYPPVAGEEVAEAFLAVEEELREAERDELARAAASLSEQGFEVTTELADGPVVRSLADEAEREADLVVMATHGRGAFSRFWLGSVADGLARTCSVPLLFVRPLEDEREADGRGDASAVPEAGQFAHVLVPLDGSRFAESGLARALPLAALAGADVTLVQVIAPVMAPGFAYPDLPEGVDPGAMEELREEASGYLGRAADRIRGEVEGEVRTEVRIHQSAAAGILEAAEALSADLVAMATHGRGGLQRLVLGSVADKVLRGSPIPVFLYRPSEEEASARSAG